MALAAPAIGIASPVAGSAASEFSLTPSLSSLAPLSGLVAAPVAVTGTGLDPVPEQNQLVFPGVGASPTVLSAFTEVSADLLSGTAAVPAGARSGPVYLRVNGVDSTEAVFFYVKSVLPKCGNVRDFDFAANGDIYAVFGLRDGRTGSVVPREAGCPTPSNTSAWAYGLLIQSGGPMLNLLEETSTRIILGSVVDKSGTVGAFLTRDGQSGAYEWAVRWWKNRVPKEALKVTGLSGFFSGCCASNFPMDFDQDNRLYFMSSDRLTRVLVPVDGPVTTEAPAELIGPSQGYLGVFAIGCDNRAYVAGHYDLSTPPNYMGYELSQIDLETGAKLRSNRVDQRYLVDMDVSCDKRKLYLSQFSDAWGPLDVEVIEASMDLDPFGFEVKAARLNVNDDPLLRIGPDGTQYSSDWDLTAGYVTRLGGGRTVFALDIPKLAGCAGTGPLAICPRNADKLEIVSETQRWKAQRSEAPMKVVFKGPATLDLLSVKLEVTAPADIGTYVPAIGEVKEVKGQYTFEWQGPWTYPMLTGSVVEQAPLPRGNYTVVVKGKKLPDSPEMVSPEYSKLSLVEVKATEIRAVSGGAALDSNPAVGLHPEEPATNRVARPGGGWRVFAEAPTAPDIVQDEVDVAVTIEPSVPEAVDVQLRLMDVDDPDGTPIDKDGDSTTTVADNNGAGVIALSVTIAADGTEGVARVKLSHQPGDNFRVVASTSRAWVDSLQAIQPSLKGEVREPNGAPLPEDTQVSEMTTVWRHLNLEIDSMARPPTGSADAERNFVEGDVTEIKSDNFGGIDRVVVKAGPGVPGMTNLDDGSPNRSGFGPGWGEGRFQNGRVFWGGDELVAGHVYANGSDYIEPPPGSPATLLNLIFTAKPVSGGVLSAGKVVAGLPAEGRFKVRPRTVGFPAQNTEPVLFTIGATTWTVPVGGIGSEESVSGPDGPELEYEVRAEAGRALRFRLVDDDQAEAPFGIDTSLLQSSDSPEMNAFAPAYLVPRVFQGPGGRIAPFVRNVECPPTDQTHCLTAEALNTLALGRDGPMQSDGFLVAFLLGAFQGPATADGDPMPDGGDRINGREFGEGAMVYSETQREGLAKCWPQTPVHETGHLLGLGDVEDDIDLMGPCRTLRSNYFSSDHIQLIRKMVRP